MNIKYRDAMSIHLVSIALLLDDGLFMHDGVPQLKEAAIKLIGKRLNEQGRFAQWRELIVQLRERVRHAPPDELVALQTRLLEEELSIECTHTGTHRRAGAPVMKILFQPESLQYMCLRKITRAPTRRYDASVLAVTRHITKKTQ